MELNGVGSDRRRLLELAAPEADEHFRRRQERQERSDFVPTADAVERIVQPSKRGVQHAHPNVG